MKRLRILKLSLALCLLIDNCIFAVNGVNISIYFIFIFYGYGLLRIKRKFFKSFVDKIYFIRKVCKWCKTFEYLRELFLDNFFESLIFCGYISFSQLPRNKVSKRCKHYLYVYPSYFNFVLLRFFNIKNTKYQYWFENWSRKYVSEKKQFFVSKFQVQWIFRRVLLIDKNVN